MKQESHILDIRVYIYAYFVHQIIEKRREYERTYNSWHHRKSSYKDGTKLSSFYQDSIFILLFKYFVIWVIYSLADSSSLINFNQYSYWINDIPISKISYWYNEFWVKNATLKEDYWY